MRGDNFLEKFGLIDEKYIEEAEEKTKRKNIKTPILIAACFMLVLMLAALPLFKKEETPPTVDPVPDETEEADISYAPPAIYDGIPYSELNISDIGPDAALDELVGGSAMLAGFFEEELLDITAVIEGRVTDVRTKRYEIITDYDKFGDGSRTHFFENSVVYDIEVEKVYKGEVSEGEIFTVEVRVIAPRYTFYLKEGHSYVIPVTTVGDDWGSWHGNIVEGSAERDSIYSILYPFHPQIERTEDGYYFFSDDWTTLASADTAVKVTMDIPYDYYRSRFNDMMMLIDGESFEKILEDILTKYN